MTYLMIVLVKVVQLVSMLLTVYMWAVIISALLSWVNPDPYNPIVRFLRNATEPVFERVRRWLPFVVLGGFDLSPHCGHCGGADLERPAGPPGHRHGHERPHAGRFVLHTGGVAT